MTPLVGEIHRAAQLAAADLRARIINVQPRRRPIDDSPDEISFTLDGVHYNGKLIGRNCDLVIGLSPEHDTGIALRVFVDGHAFPELLRP